MKRSFIKTRTSIKFTLITVKTKQQQQKGRFKLFLPATFLFSASWFLWPVSLTLRQDYHCLTQIRG